MAEPDVRVSDAERESVAARLREAGGDGRLDPDELDERLGAAYSARTRGELERLTADLPAPAPAREPALRSQAVRNRLASWITVNLACILIWLASGAHGSFWPVWVLLGTTIGLLGPLVRTAFGVEEDEEHRERPPRIPPPN